MKQITIILFTLAFLISCQSGLENESVFPKVKNVNELQKTDFVPTLESDFDSNTNTIYAATIPFAWNEIRNIIGPALSDFSSKELEEINIAKSYMNVLKKDEYETSVDVNGTEIQAKAYFRKSLPFEEPLQKLDIPLEFNQSKVESFGFSGNSVHAKINYYHSKNEFSISLFPKNNEHEIILIMHNKQSAGFKEYFDRFSQKTGLKKNRTTIFNEEDRVEIPIIEFNLEKHFDKIIGSSFNANQRIFDVVEAYQQNAFILNENGAEVESSAEFYAMEKEVKIEKIEPKVMIFDRPFVVFLKRKNAINPYFGIFIANEELLKEVK